MDWNPQVTNIHDLKISGFVPHTDVTKDGILFSVVVPEGSRASLLLYEKGTESVKCEIPFSQEPTLGRVFAMLVSGIPADRMEYNYRIDGKVVTDPSAQVVTGLKKYGDCTPRREHQIRGAFLNPAFDWGEKEKRLRIPYSKSIFYELHVRGFTKSRTSKVKNRGTFLGITEKIPYLKELGVTALVLLPCYEFDEVLPDSSRTGWRPEGLRELVAGASLPQSALSNASQGKDTKGGESETGGYRINYWGFGPGWLFAPKLSYCAGDSPADEFRTMVKLLHEAGIEVIMEMSCPEGTDPAYMQACLLWWREIYHVDGFLVLASQDDVNAVAKSPALSDVKLISDYFDTARMYPKGRPYRFRNLAEYNVGFRYDARQFLKGDSDCLQSFVSRCRYNPKDAGVINAIAGHDGFTLRDLVSYNDKHNEENGENNRDGALNEYSWNCGAEGPSRKREISRLRMRQMKNALAMVMLAQGTPMICAGDEMLNSQEGNTNPYCIDSELSWVQWSGSKDAAELHDFAVHLIAFRRMHPLLHQDVELTGSSMGGFFPDFSCHGSNAWFASFDRQERSVGMMYCSQDPDREALYQKETERRKAARKKRSRRKDPEADVMPEGLAGNLTGADALPEGRAENQQGADALPEGRAENQQGADALPEGRAGNRADAAAVCADQSGIGRTSSEESYLYVAYNLHWESRQLALPYLPSGREWKVVIDTSIDRFSDEREPDLGSKEKAKSVHLPGRSIRVLVG